MFLMVTRVLLLLGLLAHGLLLDLVKYGQANNVADTQEPANGDVKTRATMAILLKQLT